MNVRFIFDIKEAPGRDAYVQLPIDSFLEILKAQPEPSLNSEAESVLLGQLRADRSGYYIEVSVRDLGVLLSTFEGEQV